MAMVVKSWNVKCSSFQFSDGYGDYGDGCEVMELGMWYWNGNGHIMTCLRGSVNLIY